MNRFKKWFPLIIALLVLMLPFVMNSYYSMRLLTTTGIYMIIAMGLNIMLGYTGLISVGQAGIFGLSAYIVGLLMRDAGVSFWLALVISVFVGIAIGLFIGIITLRLESAYLAICTLGLALVIQTVLLHFRPITGGFEGLLKIPKPSIFGFVIKQQYMLLFIVLIFDILVFFMLQNLLKSKFGRNLRAVRDNPIAASMMGIDVVHTRLLSFTISSVLASLAGCLYAGVNGALFPDYFSMDLSVTFLCIVVLGGMGTVLGPIVGTLLVVYGKELLSALGQGQMLVFGILIVLFCVVRPGGLMEMFNKWVHKFKMYVENRKEGAKNA